jgi:membrane associated rhomboid family serine protease
MSLPSFLHYPGAATILVLTLAFSVAGLLWFPGLIERCVLRPYWLVRRGQWHTLVTSGLVHADFGHLLLNMLTFWFFAFQLERAIGTTRFVLLYGLALVASDANTYLKHRNDPDYGSLGASGAIAAVLFASIVYYPDQSLFILPIPVPIPAPLFALGYVAYSWWSARQARGRVNHDAHLGGALFGLLFVALTEPSAFRGLAALLR